MRVVFSLLPPLLILALHELVHRALFGHAVSQILGAAVPNLVTVGLLIGFYVLRLLAFFVVPGWIAVILFRLVRPLIAPRDTHG